MLRGTCYVLVDGVPTHRRVFTIDIDQVEGWKAAARTRLVGAGVLIAPGTDLAGRSTVEFGPIAPEWRKHGDWARRK